MLHTLLHTWRPIGHLHAAAHQHISHSDNAMHSLDGCSTICIVGGYFPSTLEVGRIGDNSEFLEEDLGVFLVVSLSYYYISHIHTQGVCCLFTMLGLIVEIFVIAKGVLAAI